MDKPIEQFTDEELLAVIRRAENSNIPGSLFQRASTEWGIRHQKKILDAAKSGQRFQRFIAARNIKSAGEVSRLAAAAVIVPSCGGFSEFYVRIDIVH